MIDNGELHGTFVLQFDALGDVAVADVFADPEKYVGRTMADPHEGAAYGRGKALLYRRKNGSLLVNSFAHGGRQYALLPARVPKRKQPSLKEAEAETLRSLRGVALRLSRATEGERDKLTFWPPAAPQKNCATIPCRRSSTRIGPPTSSGSPQLEQACPPRRRKSQSRPDCGELKWTTCHRKPSSTASRPPFPKTPWRGASPIAMQTTFALSQRGQWFRYDGTRWRQDDTLHAFDLARRICRAASAECNGKEGEKSALASAKTVAAVERLARSDRRIAATIDQWDADPWLLNTPDGVIDLRTGTKRAHQAADYMTKITAVGPRGDCPRFLAFLDRIMGADPELIVYLRRVLGYALTGITREHALFFGYGTGANG